LRRERLRDIGRWVPDRVRSLLEPDGGTAMTKIDITKLPELPTKVGIHGATKQREVGGAGCASLILAIITG
jgi:hypothetical protein